MTIGIKSIAAAAGVSPATVSRVLAGKSVRPAYRERVEKAMRGLDYRPNLAARRLRAPEAGAVGIIVPDLANPFFTAFVRTVEELAWREGLRVIICDSNEDQVREATYRRFLREERVAGLILAPVSPETQLDLGATPAVIFDRAIGNEPHDSVMLDNHGAATSLTGALKQKGARTVLGLFGDGGVAADARARGFADGSAAHGLDTRLASIPYEHKARRRAVEAALAEHEEVDAIVAVNSDILLEAALLLRGRLGRALACFDDTRWLKLLDVEVLVVAQPVEEMAHAALAMLVERMSDEAGEPRRLVFKAQISKPM